MTADEDGMLSGCSKWKWCINSFYIGLNLAQLQDFSLFMLLNIDSEVELELPPVCNIQDKDVLCEYLQRITLSVSFINISCYIVLMMCFRCSFTTMPEMKVNLAKERNLLDLHQDM